MVLQQCPFISPISQITTNKSSFAFNIILTILFDTVLIEKVELIHSFHYRAAFMINNNKIVIYLYLSSFINHDIHFKAKIVFRQVEKLECKTTEKNKK